MAELELQITETVLNAPDIGGKTPAEVVSEFVESEEAMVNARNASPERPPGTSGCWPPPA